MRLAAAVLRAAIALLVLAAVVATWLAVPPPGPVPQNLLGYFTIQSNLIGAAIAAAGAVRLARRTPPGLLWSVLRWCAASYLAVVGIVYWTLLAPLGAAGGAEVPWANLVLHGLTPLAAVLDWLLVRDRRRLPAALLPATLAYPLVWTVVVLIRGATDGWVPYPFLSPAQGYPVVAAWALLVAGVFAGSAALLRLLPARGGGAPSATA